MSKVTINGADKAIKAGYVLVNGVLKKIIKGICVVNGVEKTIRLNAESSILRTITFTGDAYNKAFTVECFKVGGGKRGVTESSSYIVKDGNKIIVSCGLSKDYLDSRHTNFNGVTSKILLDGDIVASGTGRVEYELTVHSDITINCRINDILPVSEVYVQMEIEQRGDS